MLAHPQVCIFPKNVCAIFEIVFIYFLFKRYHFIIMSRSNYYNANYNFFTHNISSTIYDVYSYRYDDILTDTIMPKNIYCFLVLLFNGIILFWV